MSDRVPGAACPQCGATLDAAQRPNSDGLRPKVGDVTTCLYCTAVLEFTIGMALVPASDQTLAKIAGDPCFKRANEFAAMFANRQKNKPIGSI